MGGWKGNPHVNNIGKLLSPLQLEKWNDEMQFKNLGAGITNWELES
jgi:hypothetical protein